MSSQLAFAVAEAHAAELRRRAAARRLATRQRERVLHSLARRPDPPGSG
jgi:hypothetical protein